MQNQKNIQTENFKDSSKKYKLSCDRKICTQLPLIFPPQHQDKQPGIEYLMNPLPIFDNPNYIGINKLKDKVAIVTGGDSGIGRAVSIAFAKEGAKIAIVYLEDYETPDAELTKQIIEKYNGQCLLIKGDLKNESFCKEVVDKTIQHFSKLDILVMNHGVQFPQKDILNISSEQLEITYKTNILSYFYIAKAAIPHLKEGSTIINTASITAYKGTSLLIDYSSTKGAVVSFTRSLSLSLIGKGIRVNAVAPGPIWSPLIVSSYDADYVSTFGINTPMQRAGQPYELAPTYVYLASDDSSYVSGQVLHVNGGVITDT